MANRKVVCLGVFLAGILSAQKFEVASVRMTGTLDQMMDEGSTGPAVTFSGSRVNIDGLTLKAVIATAYGKQMHEVEAPEWTAQARVVIHAEMPEGAGKERLPQMLKALLEERFHLTAHTADRNPHTPW